MLIFVSVEKHCPGELEQVNMAVVGFRVHGSRRRDRLGEPNPSTIKNMGCTLSVRITDDVAREMDIAPDLSLSISTVLRRASGINEAVSYCFVNMSAP